MKHVLSADQFTLELLQEILAQAEEMEVILKRGGTNMAERKILATLFYEPSTRTRLSFESAMLRLGGKIISETNTNFSSQTKGEILEDTIRMINGYADVIAIRSKMKGDAQKAADASNIPVLNAGDGAGEHPTQSLLDLYTIHKKFKNRLGQDTLKVAFVGDLKYGRTVHSLSKILRYFEGVDMTFVAPKEIQMPSEYVKSDDKIVYELNADVLENSDIIYDTRLQQERFDDLAEYERLKDVFVFDVPKVSTMKETAILMHPLPRINEITLGVDALPQATYFEQARNGVPIRMTLIARALGLI
ncbi:aspartate carbamoyltransferase [bacterium DOLZORAL124_38_8]|nr:MAG: aspartate carbamoyltransferase [bacterium DOLZORAL124_38_8]